MSELVESAFAKINLALHVRAREADGYHRIETIFAFAEHGDRLAATPADTISLAIIGPFAEQLSAGTDNLVMRAASDMRQTFSISAGAALTLDKRLPLASGIGGGSADAAAAIRLLARLWSIDGGDGRLRSIAAALGADVPACLDSRTARGEGRGDALSPLDGLRGTPLLLVNPGVAVPTGAVFARWDGVDRGALSSDLSFDALRAARNDLEPPAIAIAPQITPMLDWLAERHGVLLARMSGSGATCFALFADDAAAEAGSAAFRHAFPAAWCLQSRLK